MSLSKNTGSSRQVENINTNQSKGIAGFEELFTACSSMGVKFLICEMGLKAEGIQAEELRKDIHFEPGGLVTFLNSAETEGNIVFI